jgi:hypothetical protein
MNLFFHPIDSMMFQSGPNSVFNVTGPSKPDETNGDC